MPTWLAIALLALLALVVLLAVGGALAQRRRMAGNAEAFRAQLAQADRDLAAAHAADRGWEASRLEAAARDAFASEHPGAEPERLALIQVIDRPGTDEDQAVFHVEAGGGAHRLVLGRRGDDWILESLG